MKVVFFGTPPFAAKILEFLNLNGIEIVGVVSAPDKRKGRGKKIISTAVKQKSMFLGIDTITPLSLLEKSFITKIKSFNADLFIVVAFKKLPKEIWKMPKIGTINLHTSLLPNYRGAAPINRVIINGEDHTGVTTFFINEQIDSGDILLQEKINLENDITAGQLYNLLINKGQNLIINTIKGIKEEKICSTQQNPNKFIKKSHKLNKELLKINWNESAINIHNLIRGLSPYISENETLKDVSICPCAWFNFYINNIEKRCKIIHSSFSKETTNNIGEIDTDNQSYLKVNLREGSIYINKIQLAGKKIMSIKEFLLGHKIDDQWKIF